jgi:hypothetical protein
VQKIETGISENSSYLARIWNRLHLPMAELPGFEPQSEPLETSARDADRSLRDDIREINRKLDKLILLIGGKYCE